jgi:rhodanese-related sulfurtransferase
MPITTSPDALFLSPEDFEERFGFPKPDPDTEVVFYCKAGVRSKASATLAKEAGFRNVGEYRGSYMDWTANGGTSV